MSVMLSEIKKFCKRQFEWVKTNERPDRRRGEDLFLAVTVMMVAIISFGLGRLSKIREEKIPITIENAATSTGVSNSQRAALTIGEQRIFVASKNGKKYYYAWCESAQKIKEINRVWFSSKEEAERAGYDPAVNCKGLK